MPVAPFLLDDAESTECDTTLVGEPDYEEMRAQHAEFWKRAEGVLAMRDVVNSWVDVNARMFVPGDGCYGKEFGCS
ncbi:hypothetical protein C0993_005989, partial [Termitomyces sp. T159_Od127]